MKRGSKGERVGRGLNESRRGLGEGAEVSVSFDILRWLIRNLRDRSSQVCQRARRGGKRDSLLPHHSNFPQLSLYDMSASSNQLDFPREPADSPWSEVPRLMLLIHFSSQTRFDCSLNLWFEASRLCQIQVSTLFTNSS